MADNLRAGIVGLGMMGRHHARVLGQLPGVDLVAAADPSGDIYGAAGDVPIGDSVQFVLDAKPDYVVVAAPTGFHREMALRIAEAGVHVMVEKPLAPSVAEATEIAAAFGDAGLIGAVGHIERFNPALQALRERLEARELGDVYQVVTRRQGPFPARIADVGVILDLATHDIDLTAWATGSNYASVAAQTAIKSGRPHEDLVAWVGRLENGTVTSHLVNWLSPMKERVTIVTGEAGAFVADTLTADLTFYANGTHVTQWDQLAGFRGVSEGDVIRYALNKYEPLRLEHEAMRDAVLGTGTGIVTLSEGLATVIVAEALIESARSGAAVSLALD